MRPIKCPKCGLENPRSASKCECGHEFSSQASTLYNQQHRSPFIISIIVFFLSILILGYAMYLTFIKNLSLFNAFLFYVLGVIGAVFVFGFLLSRMQELLPLLNRNSMARVFIGLELSISALICALIGGGIGYFLLQEEFESSYVFPFSVLKWLGIAVTFLIFAALVIVVLIQGAFAFAMALGIVTPDWASGKADKGKSESTQSLSDNKDEDLGSS